MIKQISAGVKIAILVIVATAIAYGTFKAVGQKASGEGGYELKGRFRDATGLPVNSRVLVAGLAVGEIIERKLDGRYAILTFRIAKDAVVFDNAIVAKKASSLLGEFYLDIDPGGADVPGPDGKPVAVRPLKSGEYITNIAEAATIDDLVGDLKAAVPTVEAAVDEAKLLFADARRVINGPIQKAAENVEKILEDNRVLVGEILNRTDRAMASFEKVGKDLAYVTGGGRDSLLTIIKNVEVVSGDLKELVAVTQGEIQMTGGKIREKLDRIDKTLDEVDATFGGTASVVRKIDEDQGTLGRLVNDPQIADDFQSISSDVAGFVKTAFGLQTVVGIRSEYNFVAQSAKTYFSLELQPRPDKFYLVEIVDDPRGTITEEFALDPTTGDLVSTTTVDRAFRFTFQFAKKLGNYTLRIGIKESTGGGGIDAHFFDRKLTLNADIFDVSFADMPRMKVQAAYQFFKYLYIYGGVDDFLNKHQEITVRNPDITGDEIMYSYGRDYFGGVMLKFNDQDLSALLFIGGAAIAGVAGGK